MPEELDCDLTRAVADMPSVGFEQQIHFCVGAQAVKDVDVVTKVENDLSVFLSKKPLDGRARLTGELALLS